MKKISIERIVLFLKIFLTLFGLVIVYQILRKLLGGSWSAEDLILSGLVFNTSILITLAFLYVELRSDHKHLKNSFRSLATDFKQVKNEVTMLSTKIDRISEDVQFLRSKLQ